nr:MAG TPA: hypothetical protein [Caudoviricetes sp.]
MRPPRCPRTLYRFLKNIFFEFLNSYYYYKKIFFKNQIKVL